MLTPTAKKCNRATKILAAIWADVTGQFLGDRISWLNNRHQRNMAATDSIISMESTDFLLKLIHKKLFRFHELTGMSLPDRARWCRIRIPRMRTHPKFRTLGIPVGSYWRRINPATQAGCAELIEIKSWGTRDFKSAGAMSVAWDEKHSANMVFFNQAEYFFPSYGVKSSPGIFSIGNIITKHGTIW